MTARQRQFRELYLDQRIKHQRTYYANRAKEYREAHRQAVLLRNGLLLLAAILGVLTQAAEGGARSGWAVAAAILSAFAGAVTAYDALIGFPQLEKLYSDAEQNLEEAAIDWDEPNADMAAEIDRVEWVFRSERGQWGQLVVKSATTATPTAQDGEAEDPGRPAAPPAAPQAPDR